MPTAMAVTLPVGGALKLVKPITGAAAAAMEGAAVDEVPSAGIVVETTGAAAAALVLVAPATSATVAIDGVVVAMVGAAAVAAVGVAASEAETTGAARVAPTELAFSTVTGGAAELMFEATAAVEMLNAAVANTWKQSIVRVYLFGGPTKECKTLFYKVKCRSAATPRLREPLRLPRGSRLTRLPLPSQPRPGPSRWSGCVASRSAAHAVCRGRPR